MISGSTANLVYRAMGSGQAENEMNAVPPTQSIGFMSRNFKQAILDAHTAHNDHFGTDGWQPDTNNVLGLDAAVVVINSYAGHMTNVSMPLDPNSPGKAALNSDFALVMSGLDGAGTTAACRSQQRLDALSRLTIAMHGSGQISHIYRRNDASGTTDTMRERVRITRFCNGQAPGGVKSDGVSLWHNLDADDMDPIRRDCVSFAPDDPGKTQTRCTYWPYNATCQPGWDSTTNPVTGAPATGIPCTQGLVVALTDGDPDENHPGQTLDITRSIAQRVADDATVLGYAGREAAKQTGTAGPNINRISFADGVVRLGAYLLSRRLYLNHGDPLPNSTNPGDANYDKQLQEDTLYNWATDPATGRCHVDPIIKAKGFVTCTPSCHTWPPSGYNLCTDTPYPAAESLPGLCIATGKPGDGKLICCADGNLSTNNVNCGAPVCAANGVPCRSDADCCTNLTCQDNGTAWLCKP